MVNDSEVKAQKSPFAMRINERKVFDGKDGYVSINQVMFNVDMGYITDIHFDILEIINKYEFVTARQIFQLLLLKGVNIKSQDKVDDKLQKLIKTKVITRYYFTSEEGKGIFRVYCLEKMGKYLLNSREIKSDWQQTNNAKPVDLIKKRLAGNQIMISYLQKVKSFGYSLTNVVLYSKKQNIKFKPTGGLIHLDNGQVQQDLVFEVIRRNDRWEDKLVEKLTLYSEFYNFFIPKDCEFEVAPQLVIVAEDNEHISEIFKLIKKSGIPLKDEQMFFTTELKHLSDDLQSTLIQFVYYKENNTYKGVVVKSDLLNPTDKKFFVPKIEKKPVEKVEEVEEKNEKIIDAEVVEENPGEEVAPEETEEIDEEPVVTKVVKKVKKTAKKETEEEEEKKPKKTVKKAAKDEEEVKEKKTRIRKTKAETEEAPEKKKTTRKTKKEE